MKVMSTLFMCLQQNLFGCGKDKAMNLKKISIAAKNKGKIREMANAFSRLPIEIVSLSDFGQLPDAVAEGENLTITK